MLIYQESSAQFSCHCNVGKRHYNAGQVQCFVSVFCKYMIPKADLARTADSVYRPFLYISTVSAMGILSRMLAFHSKSFSY